MAHEPKTNTFIKSLIEELIIIWDTGFQIATHKNQNQMNTFMVDYLSLV